MPRRLGIIALLIPLLLALAFQASGAGLGALPLKVWILAAGLALAALASLLRLFWFRHVLLVTSIAYFGFFEGSCLCANGALQNIFLYSSLGRWAGVAEAAIQSLFILLVISIFGNLFCGWICHKGAVQEFLFRSRYRFKVPARVDRWLQRLKYLLLVLIVLWPLASRQKLFLKIDPFKALFNMEGTAYLFVFGAIVLLASLFMFRPFCRYVCPFGAAAGLVNHFGLFHLALKSDQSCTGCNACLSRCPAAAIRPRRGDEPACDAANCIACGECLAVCRRLERPLG